MLTKPKPIIEDNDPRRIEDECKDCQSFDPYTKYDIAPWKAKHEKHVVKDAKGEPIKTKSGKFKTLTVSTPGFLGYLCPHTDQYVGPHRFACKDFEPKEKEP